MVGLIKNLKNKYDLQVQYLCCDNTEENLAFERTCKQEEQDVDFEYTAPGIPHQKGHIKRKFATFFNQVWVMLNGMKFTAYLSNSHWTEAVNTTTLL